MDVILPQAISVRWTTRSWTGPTARAPDPQGCTVTVTSSSMMRPRASTGAAFHGSPRSPSPLSRFAAGEVLIREASSESRPAICWRNSAEPTRN